MLGIISFNFLKKLKKYEFRLLLYKNIQVLSQTDLDYSLLFLFVCRTKKLFEFSS